MSPLDDVIVTPSPFTTVEFPEVSLTVTDSSPSKSLASLTFKLLEPSDTTPMLSLVLSLFVSVIPPTTLTC